MVSREQFQVLIGKTHKMMDKKVEKSVIEDSLRVSGCSEEQIKNIFGIIIKSTLNKLVIYYGKDTIDELMTKSRTRD